MTTIRISDTASLDDHLRLLDDEVLPQVRDLDGVTGAYWLLNRHLARVVGIVLYESDERLRATAEAAANLRSSTVHRIGGTLESVQEFEVVAQLPPAPARRRRKPS